MIVGSWGVVESGVLWELVGDSGISDYVLISPRYHHLRILYKFRYNGYV